VSEPPFLPFHRPTITDRHVRAVGDAMRSGWLTSAGRAEEFEKAFALEVGAAHAVAVSSCTAALHLALVGVGVGPGDEVVTSPITFVSAVNVIEHMGAVPVFADVLADDLTIDPEAVRGRIGPRTRAIVATHFAGFPAHMDGIEGAARARGIPVITDAAHGIETVYHGRRSGQLGRAACYSFYATKNITCLAGDEPVLLRKNNRVNVHRIGDAVRSGAWEGSECVTFGEDGRFSWVSVDDAVRAPSTRRWRIKTETGRTCEVTNDHRFFRLSDGKIRPIDAHDVKIGDFLAAPRRLAVPMGDMKDIDTIQALFELPDDRIIGMRAKGIRVSGGSHRSGGNKGGGGGCLLTELRGREYSLLNDGKIWRCSSPKMPARLAVTEELMRLLGYYGAEGCRRQAGPHHSNYIRLCFGAKDETLGYVADAIACIKRVTGQDAHVYRYPKKNSVYVDFTGKPWLRLFEALGCGTLAHGKRVPWLAFNVSEPLRKEYIKALYRGDGHVRNEGSDCRYASLKTVSRELADGTMALLLSVGVFSSLYVDRSGPTSAYSVCVGGRKNAADWLSPDEGYKSGRAVSILADLIPCEESGLRSNALLPAPFRHTLRWKKRFSRSMLDREKLTAEQGSIVKGDLSFFRVIEKEMVEGTAEVYCFIVQKGHNFVGGHGWLCQHNCGEGGMLATDDAALAARARTLRLHGMSKDAWGRYGPAGYRHWDVEEPGWKYNMSDIQAALGLAQLGDMGAWLGKRAALEGAYSESLAGGMVGLLRSADDDIRRAHHLLVVRVPQRDRIMEDVQRRGVGVGVHFRAVHRLTHYQRKYGLPRGSLPVSERASDEVLSLPLYPSMEMADVPRVVAVLGRALREAGAV
jgi:dTDP-4-amino-4,6-dideoxygalactose transaminase/intein/homing endonuclease